MGGEAFYYPEPPVMARPSLLSWGGGWRRMHGDPNLLCTAKLVAKRPGCLVGRHIRSICIPTHRLGGGWLLQPRCETRDQEYGLELIKRRMFLRGLSLENHDLVTSNVGWWRGQPYLFDW